MRLIGLLLAAGRGARASAAPSCWRRYRPPLAWRRRRYRGGRGRLPASRRRAPTSRRGGASRRFGAASTLLAGDRRADSSMCERADEGMGASLACGVAAAGRRRWLDRRARGHAVDCARRRSLTVADALRGGAEHGRAGRSAASAGIQWASRATYGALLSALTGDEGARSHRWPRASGRCSWWTSTIRRRARRRHACRHRDLAQPDELPVALVRCQRSACRSPPWRSSSWMRHHDSQLAVRSGCAIR